MILLLISLSRSPSIPPSLLLCVVGQEVLQAEGALLLRADRVPPAPGEVDPGVVGLQLGHVPGVRHHLQEDPRVRRDNPCSRPPSQHMDWAYMGIPYPRASTL